MAYSTPWVRLTETVIRYQSSGDDDCQFLKDRDNLRKAAIAYGFWALVCKDPEVRVYVVRKARPARVQAQLCFWPARGNGTATVARLVTTG